ncbi:alpha/beta hydrolase [Streptomyces sp. NBC_01498]|uniref:alpha/beta fold hydrolase n=1 Tax=Streptomyces sp. NBC_01498 TaxID=2975870 RepID=UPI002E7BF5EC|nr:alpha/beta hydrolase [Streptomyces sp. NBC_01498]WTL24179.1 alpha/beta hydrolase [Streptomyces sp. NBC_01498]
MVIEQDVKLNDGRILRTYDTEGGAGDGPVVVWHHGSPQTGAPLEPLLTAAEERGVRLVTYGRPGYGGSSPLPGRNVAAAGEDVARIADALGVGAFGVMGASGGGPHALACAAALPDRVTGVVCLAGIAPYTTEFDWYAGMVAPGGLRAAADGREARELYAEADEFDPASFTAADFAALAGTWKSLGADAMKAGQEGPGGLIDDDVAFATVWGFDLAEVSAPVLLVQGGDDRVVPPAHAEWMRAGLPRAELWVRPEDGHVSVLDACPAALDWLAGQDAPLS